MSKQHIMAATFGIAFAVALISSAAQSQNSPAVANPTPYSNGSSTNTFVAPAQPPAATIIQQSRALQQTPQKPAVSTTTATSPSTKP
jgi:hypothetical protein